VQQCSIKCYYCKCSDVVQNLPLVTDKERYRSCETSRFITVYTKAATGPYPELFHSQSTFPRSVSGKYFNAILISTPSYFPSDFSTKFYTRIKCPHACYNPHLSCFHHHNSIIPRFPITLEESRSMRCGDN